ncbi:hypothetical protein KLK06_54775 [Nonomuraea sp. NEAU-A123]|nr:hypothetical protein [Nonomuraea sp. NEAU-A123]
MPENLLTYPPAPVERTINGAGSIEAAGVGHSVRTARRVLRHAVAAVAGAGLLALASPAAAADGNAVEVAVNGGHPLFGKITIKLPDIAVSAAGILDVMAPGSLQQKIF